MKNSAVHVIMLHVARDNCQETGKQPQKPISPKTGPLNDKAEGESGEKEKRPPIRLVTQERL